jgi:pyrroloquinoline quinone (PQQ) biosynthesis protein C
MDDTYSYEETSRISSRKHAVLDWLELNAANLLRDIQEQEFWSIVMSPDSDRVFVRALIKEVYTEIVGYQPRVIEAAIAAIAQMPRSMSPRLIKSMLIHQADEFEHGEMALRDLLGLGESESEIRKKRISPEAFAVAGVWWMIVHERDPFAYLGALYLFEGLTPIVTGLVKGRLQAKGLNESMLGYIEFHSTEDIKHANLVNFLISKVASDNPDSVESIKHGFESFRAVYPIPLWRAAFERAKANWHSSNLVLPSV